MRQRYTWILALAALGILTIIGGILNWQRTLALSERWHQSTESTKATALLSHDDGNVSALNCGKQDASSSVSTFAADGAAAWQIPYNAGLNTCASTHAVAADGTFYSTRGIAGSSATEIVAYKNGVLQWHHQFKLTQAQKDAATCADSALRIKIVKAGPGSTIYVALDEASAGIIGCQRRGYIGGVDAQGQELFLTDTTKNEIKWLGVAKDQLLVLHYYDYNHTLDAYDFTGTKKASTGLALLSDEDANQGYTATDLDGRVYSAITKSYSWSDQCRTSQVATAIARYTPDGTHVRYELPECHVATSVASGPWGAAFVVDDRRNAGNKSSILIFDQDGQLIKALPLPDAQGDKRFFANGGMHNVITGDTNGNLMLVRRYVEWPQGGDFLPPEQLVTILNPQSGDTIKEFDTRTLSDNTAEGFIFNDVALANSTLYILGVTCPNVSCNFGTQHQLYNIPLTGLGLDYPRGALLHANQPPRPKLNYVALGDSFSSGEGVEPFDPETNISKGRYKNTCHRSKYAYPRELVNDPSLNKRIELVSFKACSGATTRELLNKWNRRDGKQQESAQVEYLSKSTNMVSLTIGGNDVGFSRYAMMCRFSTFTCLMDEKRIKNEIVDHLPYKLNRSYKEISKRVKSESKIYVMGYPQILPEDISWFDFACRFNPPTADSTRRVVSILDFKIWESTRKAGSQFVFIDPTQPESPFIGNELCKETPYFNDISWPIAYSYHPNKLGQHAYKTLLSDRARDLVEL